MDSNKISIVLQDLIIRLKDVEEGYKLICEKTNNKILAEWTQKIANERYLMYQKLMAYMHGIGEKSEIYTSFLGDTYRMFIQIKSELSWDDTTALIEEIERGSDQLLKDYNNLLQQVKLPTDIATTLMSQKVMIENEANEFKNYKENIEELVG